jgi:hypothetical protein
LHDRHILLEWIVRCAAQVADDWHGAKKKSSGELEDDAAEQVSDRIERILARGGGNDGSKASLMSPYQSNLENLAAWDHALAGSTRGNGLAYWGTNKVGFFGLGPDEVRYFEPEAELPYDLVAAFPDRIRRSCIFNSRTDTTRLEVSWGGSRPSIWDHIDQGSKSWPARHVLFAKMGIRGGYFFDPLHKKMRIKEDAYNKSQLLPVKTGRAILNSYLHGPWDTYLNWTTIKGLLDEFFLTFGPDNALWLYIYPSFCQAFFLGKFPQSYGTLDHVQEMFEMAKHGKLRTTPSNRMKVGRWNAFEKKTRSSREDAPLLHLALLYKAFVKGGITDRASLIRMTGLCLSDRSIEDVTGAAGSSGDAASVADAVATVAASNADLEKIKRTTGSNASLCLKFMSGTLSTRLSEVMVTTMEPQEIHFDKLKTQLKTQSGCVSYYTTMSLGKGSPYIKRMWEFLSEQGTLRQVGFLSSSQMDICAMAEEKVIAETMVELIRNYVAGDITVQSTCMNRPPYAFFGLLDKVPEVVMSRLQRLELLFEDLGHASTLLNADEDLQGHLQVMQWPYFVWDVEMLVGLAEVDFKHVPEIQEQEILNVARGLVTSEAVESAHGKISHEVRQSQAGRLGRTTKMHRLITSGLAQECDRPPPMIDHNVIGSVQGVRIESTQFEAKHHIISLGKLAVEHKLRDKARPTCGLFY